MTTHGDLMRVLQSRGIAGISGNLTIGHIRAAAEARALAPLPKYTQEVIDQAVVRIGRQRLQIVEDFLATPGLVVPMPNWLSIPTLTSHKIGEAGNAQVTMTPKSRGERQIMQWTPYTIPIYTVWDDCSFEIREMMAAARVGQPLDTTHIEQATRNVNEKVEDIAINGSITVDGNATPGLLDTTNTQAYGSNEAWTAAGHSGQDILQDVLNMVDVLKADKFYGPYNLYYPTTYETKLMQNWSDGTNTFPITIKQRLEQLEFGGRNLRCRVADYLPTDRTLLIQMTNNVLDVIVGQAPTTVSWTDGPGWERYFVVLACIVPRIKSDANSNFGICAGNLT